MTDIMIGDIRLYGWTGTFILSCIFGVIAQPLIVLQIFTFLTCMTIGFVLTDLVARYYGEKI